ncbi:hypothetical protein BC833DRAFT_118840 [Globomyces pollinis-pini]|nr:hypothetical protein BC833DRAFT_118840 [Globomyces pollinis-pini]
MLKALVASPSSKRQSISSRSKIIPKPNIIKFIVLLWNGFIQKHYPTNEQLERVLKECSESQAFASIYNSINPTTRSVWTDFVSLLDSFRIFLKRKNPGNQFQTMMYYFDMISDNLEVIQDFPLNYVQNSIHYLLLVNYSEPFRDSIYELSEILTRLTGAVDVEIKYQTQSPEPSDTQSEPILHGHQATSKLKRVETVHDFRTEEMGDGSPIQEFEKLETGGEVEGIETTTPKYEATPNHSPKGKQSMLPTPSKSPKPFDTEAQEEEEENDDNPFLVTAGFEKDYLYAGSEFLEKKSVLEDLEPTEYEKVNIATSIVQWLNNFEKSDVKLTFLESILQYMQRKIENLSSTTFQAPDCPYLDQAWQSFRMILGTFANGVDLRPYDDEFKHIREQIPGDPNLHEHLRGWLDYLLHCVQVPDFRNSPESVFRCESLITEFTSRIYPIYSPSFNKLADGLYNIAEGLKEDSNSLTIIRLLKQIYATLTLDS